MDKACETCAKYLGGGCCAASLERECADGAFERWEKAEAGDGRKKQGV